jgi:hypothetical protein
MQEQVRGQLSDEPNGLTDQPSSGQHPHGRGTRAMHGAHGTHQVDAVQGTSAASHGQHDAAGEVHEAARLLREAVRQGDGAAVDRAIARLHAAHREEHLEEHRRRLRQH